MLAYSPCCSRLEAASSSQKGLPKDFQRPKDAVKLAPKAGILGKSIGAVWSNSERLLKPLSGYAAEMGQAAARSGAGAAVMQAQGKAQAQARLAASKVADAAVRWRPRVAHLAIGILIAAC